MLTKDSVEWWQDLLDRYEAVRGRMTQVEFCEREGVSHNAFVHRMFGKWPPRRSRRTRGEEAEPVSMLPVKVVEPISGPKLAWVEAEVRAGVVLRFLPGTDAEYMASLLLRLAEGSRAVGQC